MLTLRNISYRDVSPALSSLNSFSGYIITPLNFHSESCKINDQIRTLRKLLKGLCLSSWGRFPTSGSPMGPGGKLLFLLLLTLNSHSSTKISPAKISVAENSIILPTLCLLVVSQLIEFFYTLQLSEIKHVTSHHALSPNSYLSLARSQCEHMMTRQTDTMIDLSYLDNKQKSERLCFLHLSIFYFKFSLFIVYSHLLLHVTFNIYGSDEVYVWGEKLFPDSFYLPYHWFASDK